VVTGSKRWTKGSQEVPGLVAAWEGGDDALDRIAHLASRVIGSEVALVSLVDKHRQFFAGQHGLDAPWRDARETPLSQSICRWVVATGDVVQVDDTAADDRTAGHEAQTVLEVGSYLGAPLSDEAGNVLGSLCVINHHPHAWTSDERDLLVELSAVANSELRGRIAAARASDANRRVQLVADASEALSRSLDVEASLKAMLDIVTAGLAAVCVVYLPEGPDGHRRLVWPGGRRSSLELAAPTPALEELLASGPVTAVLSGASSYQRLAGARLSGPPGGDREVLVIPLPWHGEVLGVWLLEPAGRPRFADLDVTLLVDLGRRAAVTLHNARAYDHERAVAVRLQRDLLSALPDINGLELYAVYEPSDIGAEVGGDWYDVAQTPSGPVLASVGDVTGHDLRAAAAMGRLSAAIRCYAHDGLPPADILARLDGFAHHLLGYGLFATAICISLTPTGSLGDWDVRTASAGHLPPLLVPRSGTPTALEITVGQPLGLNLRPRATTKATLRGGDILVLYSDGLVEHRHEDIEAAIGRLVDVAAALDNTGPIDDYCHKLLIEARPSREDDIALLVLRAQIPCA
jgi:GAF domain-containing protein